MKGMRDEIGDRLDDDQPARFRAADKLFDVMAKPLA
jgi:hypothetical protein